MSIRKIKPSDLFVIIGFAGIIYIIIMLAISGGQFLADIVWDARNPFYPDFFWHVDRVRGGRNPYVVEDWDARFPALAYMFYYFLSCIIPQSIPNSSVADWYNLYMVVILCICVVCITVSFIRLTERSLSYIIMAVFIFLMSHAFSMAEVKAGNSAVYVLTLLMLALALKDSESSVKRELALILIAMAAGFKMSPAIFGLIYLKEKRYKETVRLVIYGIIAFFAPFAMFGGMEGLKIFLNISSQVSSAAIPRPETIPGVFTEVFSVLGLGETTGLTVGKIAAFIYLALCIWLFYMGRYSWKLIWLLSSLMVIFVNLSYPYTLQYFLIPLTMFIIETDKSRGWLDYVYAALFALIWLTPPLIKIDWPTATFITNYFWVYVMMIIVVIDVFISVKRRGFIAVNAGNGDS